jgi:hypothetical protein
MPSMTSFSCIVELSVHYSVILSQYWRSRTGGSYCTPS